MQSFESWRCFGIVVLALACGVNVGLAADRTSYSGKYLLQETKHGSGNKGDSTIEVVQTEDSIEITEVEQSARTTNRYPSNGSDGDYITSTGARGKCRAQITDKYLLLESVVATKPQPNAAPMRVHTKERWQLSKDAKVLTIKLDVDFPDAPSAVSTVVGESVSGTRKYLRIEN